GGAERGGVGRRGRVGAAARWRRPQTLAAGFPVLWLPALFDAWTGRRVQAAIRVRRDRLPADRDAGRLRPASGAPERPGGSAHEPRPGNRDRPRPARGTPSRHRFLTAQGPSSTSICWCGRPPYPTRAPTPPPPRTPHTPT